MDPEESEIYEVWGTIQTGSCVCAARQTLSALNEPMCNPDAVTRNAPPLVPLYSFIASSLDEAGTVWDELSLQEWPVEFPELSPAAPDVWSLV